VGRADQPRGKDGRWISRGGGGLLGAVVLALALAGGAGGAGVGTGSSGGLTQPGSSTSAKARDRDPGPVLRRLAARNLDVQQQDAEVDSDCAAHSYGAVRRWFAEHPCAALFRTSFIVRATGGQTVLVAVAWVDMPSAASAREFHELVDGEGTGNVTELTRERGRYTDVRFTGEHYESAREDITVVNVQAQPVERGVAPAELEGIVRSALP
jgi:hypothetical protein